ncbi:MAG TPA: hypothetical protein VGG32_01045 [Thermoplasmata archaeon]
MRACRGDVVSAIFDVAGNAGRVYGKSLGGVAVTKRAPEACHICGAPGAEFDVRIRNYPSTEERDRALQEISDMLEKEHVVSPDRTP